MALVGPQRHRKQKKEFWECWFAEYRLIKNLYEVNFDAYRPPNDPHFISSLNRTFCLSTFLTKVYPTNSQCTT